MPTTIGGKEIATTGSGHVSPGPPATSMVPPTPPAGPVPAVFVYVARSATATDTSSKLKVGGHPVLVVESAMNVEQPGNQPSQPTGGDVVTHAVVGKAATFTGAAKVKADNKKVCCTGDSTYLNVPTPSGKVAQSTGKLIAAADYNASGANYAAMAATPVGLVDPVSVATGEVIDEDVELELFGLLRVAWKRLYCSSRNKDRTPLGRGGWTHAFHQRIEIEAERITLVNEDGRLVHFPRIEPRGRAFVRARRLELVRGADDTFSVRSLDTRLTRSFAALERGGPAVLREIRDAWGKSIELSYERGRLARVTDPAGRELRLEYDAEGRVERVEAWARGAAQQAVAYAYTDEGELASATNALGHALRYVYDGHHRMVKKTLENGLSFYYHYDEASGRCVRAYGDGGLHAAEIAYDLEQGTTTATGTPKPRVFTWNQAGAVLREQSPDGLYAYGCAYDEDLFVLAEKNAAGEEVTFAYDERGNRTRVTDLAGNSATWEYEDDLPVKRTAPGGLVTTYAHDAQGALVRVTYPSGAEIALSYDGRGRLDAIYDDHGLHAAFEYDAEDNVARERDALGNVAEYAYDPLGRPVARRDALGRTVQRAYDAIGRPIGAVYPDGSRQARELDRRGKAVRELDQEGRVTERQYGGTGMLLQEVGPDGGAWEVAYDKLERLRRLTNPKREVYEFAYHRSGYLREERPYDGRVLSYAYTKTGKLARIERSDGAWQALAYDAGGQIIEESSPHGARRYTRDEHGAIVHAVVEEASGEVAFTMERDHLGRVVADTQGGRTIRHVYDGRGRRVARVLPDGQTTRYEYDLRGACVAVHHEGTTVRIERDRLGREVRRSVEASGVAVQRSYDVMDRLVAQAVTAPASGGPNSRATPHHAPGGAGRHEQAQAPAPVRISESGEAVLCDRRWAYDAKGRVTAIADARFGATRYAYDASGQLVEATRGSRSEIFEYDAAGSLVDARSDPRAPGRPWSVRPGNVLQRTPSFAYAYDEGRRRRQKVRLVDDGEPTGEATEYLWDCRDQLREARLPDGSSVRLTYDAFGRRVRKEIVPPLGAPGEPERPSRVVEYLWDGHVLAAEIDAERGTRVFVHEPESFVPLLQVEQGEAYLYVNDHLGTPKELVSARGEVAWAAAHGAWGAVVEAQRAPAPGDGAGRAGSERPVESPFRLLGQIWDEETGLCFTRFRLFDPETARFLSPDPLGVCGGRNLAALNGCPTMHTDPYGLTCVIGVPAFDAFLANAMNIPPKPGYYDVIVHGSPDAIWIKDANENWRSMTPQELAALIRRQPDYVPGTPIRLLSCETGQVPNGFAQQLSNEMGVQTQGATQYIWAWPNGAYAIAPVTANSNPPAPNMANAGHWNYFNPPPPPPPSPP